MIALPTPEARAALIERVKALLLAPKDEWPKVAAEPATIASLYSNYVIYLAAIPPLSLLIGSLVFGYGVGGITYRPSFFGALANAILQYGFQLGGVYVLAWIVEWLAPRFGGDKDRVSAFKLAAYASTASWLAGIFSLVPMLGILGLLGLYSLYLLYTGAPVLMRVPPERAGRFTLSLIAIGFVIALVVLAITAAIMPSRGTVAVEESGGTISLPGGVTLDMDKLDKASKQLEQMANQAEQTPWAAIRRPMTARRFAPSRPTISRRCGRRAFPPGLTAATSPRHRPARRGSISVMPRRSMPRAMRASRCR